MQEACCFSTTKVLQDQPLFITIMILRLINKVVGVFLVEVRLGGFFGGKGVCWQEALHNNSSTNELYEDS